MRQAMTWARGGVGLLIAIGALQGCGGGGGGGGGGGSTDPATPTVPDRNTPLRLGGSNFSIVAAQGLRAAETTLRLAQQAVVEVSRLGRNGTLQMDVTCLDAGTAHYSLIDSDSNGVPSAGDSVKVDYTRCYLDYLGAPYTGTLVVRLTSVGNASDGVLSGTVDFGAGLLPINSPLSSSWLGTLDFRRTVTDLKEQLEVSTAAADDLRRAFRTTTSSGSSSQVEAYRRPQFVRVLQRDTARASVTGSMGVASDRFGGRVDILIEPQLGAYLDTHADLGSVRISGASNTRITLRADAAGAQTLQAELDSTGDGVADSTAALEWNSVFDGYLWSEQSLATVGYLGVRNDRLLRLLSKPDFVQLKGVDVGAPLRLQFDRPLASDSVLRARLVDISTPLDYQYGVSGNSLSDVQPIIDADVQFRGAVVLILPRGGLRYGHNYQLQVSNIGNFTDAQPVTLRAATTGAEINLNVLLSLFNSDDMLWAAVGGAGNRSVVMPGIDSTVSVTVPRATSLPLRYQWSQLSGPALVLTSSTAPSIGVRLADGGPSGIDRAVLQLTVTDAIGRSSSVPVEMQVANLSGVSTVLYFSSAAGDYIGGSQTRVYSNQTGSFLTDTTLGFLTARYFETNPGVTWNLQLGNASGGVPTVGTYTGAMSFPGSTNVAPRLDFHGSGRACRSAGNYTVLESVIDSGGVVQRLAVDFDQTCVDTNSQFPLRGSVRINSSLPIRP